MNCPGTGEKEQVHFTPSDMIERQRACWPGLRAELVTAKQRIPFEYRYRADEHLLIAAECSERDDGETLVEGLPKSTRRSLSRQLTFVPAGHTLYGWQNPRVLARVNYFYIDKRGPLLDESLHFAETEFRPRLFFFDEELWRITSALKTEGLSGTPMSHYGEALGVLLGHELVRINGETPKPAAAMRGGLSGWQKKKVADFIEEHVSEELRLAALAGLVDLSPFHFARAFRQSFGAPPHRYHNGRRMQRAKELLAEPSRSVTEIARDLGFAETSSFSTAFRKSTGASPRAYRRALG